MKDKPTTDVSIIAPNYNNGRYLAEFIESVVASDVWPKELIIINDGSTDDSLSILRRYDHFSFMKVISFDQNRGLTAALNAGLEAAGGKYIMRADPDDRLKSHRIATQFQYLESHPEVDVIGSNVEYFSDKNGKVINCSNFPLAHKEIAKRFKAGEHGVQHPSVMIRAGVYKQYRYQKIFPAEDYEIFSRMVVNGCRFANISEPLYQMRVHTGSSTSNIKLSDIRQTFQFRDSIFKTKTNIIWMLLYYVHIKNYRKYQIHNNIIKYIHLIISIATYPKKIISRMQS